MKDGIRQPATGLTFDDAVEVWRRKINGEFQNRIAGRILM